jgi:low temperature requirement protein LtrA
MAFWGTASLLRSRDGHEAKVSNVELFFDLVYVFAVTQLSHRLLHDYGFSGAVEAAVLWFGVWLAWQYTCWVTNWFDPEAMPMRLLLFAIMLCGLVMAAAIPSAFGARALLFAGGYVAIQLGRTLFVLAHLGRHPLAANFRRILGWTCISACLWIAGGLVAELRLPLWIAAVACDYLAPMTGFRLPGMGRSLTTDWTIEGGHIAERCQQFVIVALGESILVTGATLSETADWSDLPVLIAFLVAFIGALAMWWVYFDTGSQQGSEAILHAEDPGRMGASFHYVHAVMVAGVIVSAVANELVIDHPDGRITMASMFVLTGGPLLYLLGNGIYKTLVFGRFPLSHIGGLVALAILMVFAPFTDLLMVGGLVTMIMLAVAIWETLSRRGGSSARVMATD